ncbi:MAG: hypothetical protein HKN43_15015, partial [Rhodothermales bacterium]|nr:hypothetical protein [Rhodothermales bacterium]
MDATAPGLLSLVEPAEAVASEAGVDPHSIYGVNNLAHKSIPIRGGRVMIHGSGFMAGDTLSVRGNVVPVDQAGKIATEIVLPFGAHVLPVTLTGVDDRRWRDELHVDLDANYFLMVGIADVTVGSNQSVEIEPLAGDENYDGTLFADGRVAMYLKGKVKGKYLVTAKLDTDEDELSNLASNVESTNPRGVFRHLDPDRYYPVYGDNSVTKADAPSQSGLYVRVEWDQSKAIIGNFNTDMLDTEFAQYNRSLYGAVVDVRGNRQNSYGDPWFRASSFVSNTQTAFAHEEFQATGGSLFYLRELNIVRGSAKVYVEVRDRDTERVVDRVLMQRGKDYEIDDFQGRIILARPLTQISQQVAPSIITDGPLDGNRVILQVDYEYVTSGIDTNRLGAGGRAKIWLADDIGLGGTYVYEDRDATSYSLYGADVEMRAGQGTFLKLEAAGSESDQASRRFTSSNGGLTFDPSRMAGDASGVAFGLNARASLLDVSDVDLTGSMWWRTREAGFSTARLATGVETQEYGAETLWRHGRHFEFASRLVGIERVGVRTDQRASAQASYDFGIVDASSEIRYTSTEDTTRGLVDAMLAAGKIGFDVHRNVNVYGVGQVSFNSSDTYESNNRLSVGVRSTILDRFVLRAEGSNGDRGFGLLGEAEFAVTSGAS